MEILILVGAVFLTARMINQTEQIHPKDCQDDPWFDEGC